MVAFVSDLAAKHPIGPGGIGDNQWHGNADANQHEYLAAFGRGNIPYGEPRWDHVRPHGNAQSCHAEKEQRKAEPKWL